MKLLIPTLFSLLLIALPARGQLYLSDPIPVAPDNTYGQRAPRIALTAGNTPLVYWGKTGAASTLYLARWEEDGFGQPMAVPTGDIEPDLFGGGLGPQLAARGNTVYLVFEKYGQGIYCLASTDGGTTFGAPVSVFDPPAGRVGTLPSVAVRPDGNPVVSFITTNNQEQAAVYEVVVSEDGGQSFAPPVVASAAAEGEEVCECCPASVAVSSNEEFYLAFRNNDNNIRDHWVARTTDGGATFPEAADIDATDWMIQSCPQSGPAAFAGGDTLYAVFYSAGEGPASVYHAALHLPTMEATVQFNIPRFNAAAAVQSYPRIAGSGDTLAAVWQESAATGSDIILAWSASGSRALRENVVNIAGANLSQTQPDIAYADGLFHIVYSDQAEGRVMYRQAGFEPFTGTAATRVEREELQIFPNPAVDQATVVLPFEGPSSTVITLRNLQGQVVGQMPVNTQAARLPVGHLPAGLYFVEARQRGRICTGWVGVE